MADNTSIIDRVKTFFGVETKQAVGGAEGSWRGPFFGVGELGNTFRLDPLEDGWQRNLDVSYQMPRHVPTVYACVMAIARAISQCYPTHVSIDRKTEAITKVTNSAAYRVLNNPNSYQTTPLFLLNMIATALFEGESFAVAARNDRQEVSAIHPMPPRSTQVQVAEDGSVFYAFGSNDLAQTSPDFVAPARDVLHIRFHTPRHPLIGESAIKAAAMAIGINVALSASQTAFFNHMSRPSGILSTDQSLQKEQMLRLREAFNEQSKMWAQGGVPILSNGLKFQQLAISSEDAQLVEAQRMSIEEICRVYGVPPPLIGELSKATLNNAETLISNFMSISLGSYLETVESFFSRLFGLGNNEYIELDTSALLRTDFANRIDGLAKGVQGGILTPDEARGREGLGPIPGGDKAFLQKQMTPVDLIAEMAAVELETAKKPPPPPVVAAPPPAPANDDPAAAAKMLDKANALVDGYWARAT